jgi:hypothetical protein
MKFKLLGLALLILLGTVATASAATTGLDWAFFKNYMAPAWVWGQNGLITIPIAETLGKGHVALSFNGIDSGKLQDKQLVYTTASLQIGTSSDVELGYTKKFLVWNWMRTDIEGETLHLKVKVFDVSESAPKISLGTIAFALTNKDNYSAKDMFFDVFAVLSQNLSIARIHLGYEFGMVGQATSKAFFFAGTDIPIGPFSILGEYVGSDKEGQGGVSNAGLSFRALGNNLIISAAATNIGQPAGTRYMLQSSVLF